MVEILQENWEKILKSPKNYVFEDQDLAIMKIASVAAPANPLILMVGKDIWDGRYYIVVEDNDTSEDIYLEKKEKLYDKFKSIADEYIRKDELLTLLYTASTNANLEPVWTDNNGNTMTIGEDLRNLLNDILERAYLPYIVDVVIDAGYRAPSK